MGIYEEPSEIDYTTSVIMRTNSHVATKILLIILSLLLATSGGLCYYYIPRQVSFRQVDVFLKPSGFDASRCIGFQMAEREDRLYYWLTAYLNNHYDNTGYDSTFVASISQRLDYKNHDYVIAYQKRILKLQHSPHLTKTKDGLYFDKRIPLIPVWDTTITDKIYLYEIPKRNYRAPGP